MYGKESLEIGEQAFKILIIIICFKWNFSNVKINIKYGISSNNN